MPNPLKPDRIDTRFWPSILQQTRWPCNFFNFRKAQTPGVSYFNCGLVRRPDGLWLVTRRSRNEKNVRIGFNDVVPFYLDPSTMLPEYGRKLTCPTNFDREHFEDPRAIFHKGKTYVSACNFVVTHNGSSWTGAHQVMLEVAEMSRDEWRVSRRIDPIYGNNGPRIGADKGMEKNWLWFFHEDKPHLVYQAWPHQVVRFSPDWTQEYIHETGTKELPWEFGTIRGGTPPALSPDGKEYWTFFHSSLKLNDQYRRRYYMGSYAFEAKPPFRITKITPEPLLAGSSQDQWAERKPLVVFPCGSELNDGEWLVTMGVNDLCSAWIRIPHDDLVEKTVDVIPKERGVLGALFKRTEKPVQQPVIEAVPHLKDVTLICIDDMRPKLADRALKQCTKELQFADVKLLTTADHRISGATTIHPIRSVEEYSRFMVKDLIRHVKTSHVLVVQWDGYVLNPKKWNNDWLRYDYIGAPWKLANGVGNGGFSLRSKKLLNALQYDEFGGHFMPEDQRICIDWREPLEGLGVKFSPVELAKDFSVENDVYESQFGFHSFLTDLPAWVERPKIFHHSGDYGDIIYSLASVKSAGGGVMFISPNTAHQTRQRVSFELSKNIIPLINQQSYIWRCQFTGDPVKPDYDLNKFRDDYKRGESLVDAHFKVTGQMPDYSPWLSVDYPIEVPGRHIVVSRSQRYHNTLFPWKQLVDEHGKQMIFVGTEAEHEDFIREFGSIPKASTPTLLDVARLIFGCWTFIGNQSAPMAIAIGLGIDRIIQETWDGPAISLGKMNVPWDGSGDANCRVPNRNIIYCMGETLSVPKKWWG